MPLEPEEAQQTPAVAAFIAELRHWREVTGYSQKALARLVGYTPSYVSKVERGTVLASRSFAESADTHLRAGRAIMRRWRDMHEALVQQSGEKGRHDEPAGDDPQSGPGPDLVVDHEVAELTYGNGVYRTRIRRQLRNTGTQPVTQYLIRIAVDRYPGDPERSNRLYREDPLTWEELVREGIDVGCIETRSKVATTVCLCFVADDGESSIVWHIDDALAVRQDTVQAAEAAFECADAVLITFELPVSTIREAIGAAHRCGARVIVQPAPVLADPAGAMSLPWDQVDVLVPNEAEARVLLTDSQVDHRRLADGLAGALAAKLGVPTVMVTLGQSGCVIHSAGVTRRYPVQEVQVVDTTGASDAFTATFAAHITASLADSEAIQAAQSAAAWAIRHSGGHESMPFSGSVAGE